MLKNTPAALATLQHNDATRFLVDLGVFTQEEIDSRYYIYAEKYIKTIDIEAATLAELARTIVSPACEAQIVDIGQASAAMAAAKVVSEALVHRVGTLARLIDQIDAGCRQIAELRHKAHDQGDIGQSMRVVADELVPVCETLRRAIDSAEELVADSRWPLAKYREMLFLGV